MATFKGVIKWGKVPDWGNSDVMYAQQSRFTGNSLVSANQPMIYQIVWEASGKPPNYTPEDYQDVVNIVFQVYETTEFPSPANISEWELIGQIKKSRDIPNTNVVNGNVPSYQRFTVDISRMVADQLSYSLVPIGKGSWENTEYGGLNGGTPKQDNIVMGVSPYNVTRNGAIRTIRVEVYAEVFASDLSIVKASGPAGGGSYVSGEPADIVRAINSVASFSSNTYLNRIRQLNEFSPTQVAPRRALTNSPNATYNNPATHNPYYKKPIRLSDQAEFLYFYVGSAYDNSDDTEKYNLYEVYGKTYNAAGIELEEFVLGSNWETTDGSGVKTTELRSDISHSFLQTSAGAAFEQTQKQICVQNVSAGYINAHAYPPQQGNYPYGAPLGGGNGGGPQFSPINSDTAYYKVFVRGNFNSSTTGWTQKRHSSVYWYKINREEEKSVYQHVRFHWLNAAGGIDSYTATRNVLESISASRSVMETQLPDRIYMQDTDPNGTALSPGDYFNDTMRGFNTYRGGTEVLSVDAKINNSVYTEPLNALEAKWLKEIFQSPNVWIEEKAADSDEFEYETDAAFHMNTLNSTLRPVKTIYKPVIITNSEVVSLDQEKGLVMYNLEYTHSQGIPTQRN